MHSKFSALEMSSDSEEEEPVVDIKPSATKPSVTKPAPWAKPETASSSQPRKPNWTDMYDSEEED
jgi:hypothetical protein